MKAILSIVFLMAVSSTVFGQEKTKVETVVIQTSAECDMCKERIEEGLNYTKGVVFAELDMESMKLTVKYKTKVITKEAIKKKITSLGYSADEMPAEAKGLAALPACCKPGSGQEHK